MAQVAINLIGIRRKEQQGARNEERFLRTPETAGGEVKKTIKKEEQAVFYRYERDQIFSEE